MSPAASVEFESVSITHQTLIGSHMIGGSAPQEKSIACWRLSRYRNTASNRPRIRMYLACSISKLWRMHMLAGSRVLVYYVYLPTERI